MPVNVNLTNVVGDYVPIGGGTMTGNLTLNDDIVALFGTGGTVSVLYETADANANALIFVAPEGGATDVPAFIFGDASILNSDLGWFNGLTEPSIVVVNDAKDAYVSLDAGDDAVAASKGLYFKAAADEDIELVNLSVTGTPRVYWDESEDQFRFSKGVVFDAACDVQGTWVATATWTIPAVTLGGNVDANSVRITNAEFITVESGGWFGSQVATATVDFSCDSGTQGTFIRMFGSSHATTPGKLVLYTLNAAGDAAVIRATFTGKLATDVLTWAATTHTGLVITSGQKIEGAGTGANGFILKNLKNAAATALSGTQLDVEIDIGGTPYYFTTYPTKA